MDVLNVEWSKKKLANKRKISLFDAIKEVSGNKSKNGNLLMGVLYHRSYSTYPAGAINMKIKCKISSEECIKVDKDWVDGGCFRLAMDTEYNYFYIYDIISERYKKETNKRFTDEYTDKDLKLLIKILIYFDFYVLKTDKTPFELFNKGSYITKEFEKKHGIDQDEDDDFTNFFGINKKLSSKLSKNDFIEEEEEEEGEEEIMEFNVSLGGKKEAPFEFGTEFTQNKREEIIEISENNNIDEDGDEVMSDKEQEIIPKKIKKKRRGKKKKPINIEDDEDMKDPYDDEEEYKDNEEYDVYKDDDDF